MFSFDLRNDSPDAEILDYRYGKSGEDEVYANPRRVSEGEAFLQESMGARMPRGEYLYVKWRIKSSGEMYEDRVDLRSRLPRDMNQLRIHLVPKGPVLYVYLIWPDDGHRYPPGELNRFVGQKRVRIYPDQVQSRPN